MTLAKEINAQEEKKLTHVDEFIDFGSSLGNKDNSEIYARWVLNHFRLPAVTNNAFDSIMSRHLLFCQYKGDKYRVTGASRMGDIWLAKDFKRKYGYDLRVCVDDCTAWSKN